MKEITRTATENVFYYRQSVISLIQLWKIVQIFTSETITEISEFF